MNKVCKYSDKYLIYNNGSVYSFYTNKYLKLCPDKDGYFHINLWYNNTRYNKKVHRLVAEHFIDNPLNKPHINHIDGNKQNNNVSNLEWATVQENNIHALETGLRIGRKGITHHNAKLTESDILEIRKLSDQKISQSKIAKLFNTTKANISKIKLRTRWGHV